MNLEDLNSGIPVTKPWLNINAGSINADTSVSSINLTQGSQMYVQTPGTLTLMPQQIVSSVIGFAITGTLSVTLPSATDLTNYVIRTNQFNLTTASFKCHLTNSQASSGTGIITFIPGAGTNTFDTQSQFILNPSQSIEMTYYYSNVGWHIYY